MYRILIADDEGLMLEAFKGVILAEFGDKCSVETAKTGRAVIEKAETFHPDIVFMDIHSGFVELSNGEASVCVS